MPEQPRHFGSPDADNGFEWADGLAARLERNAAAIDDFHCQYSTLVLLRMHLVAARNGTLEPDWRDSIVSAADPDDAEGDGNTGALTRAASDLADSAVADWEPDRGVGWRTALDCWFEAIKTCLGDLERLDGRLRDELDVSFTPPVAGGIELDLMTASYRAGLAAGGLDVDWFDWLIERVHGWPDRKLRDSQLDLMTMDPDYRAATQRLPDYWR